MTENFGENIVGISYWKLFPGLKLSMHKWRIYDVTLRTFEAKYDVI